MRRCAIAVALALCVAATPVASRAADTWAPRPADFPGTVVERDVRITMSDGVRLAADVIHPADAGGTAIATPLPVLVTQTPYNKNVLSFSSTYLVQRGYVQVIAEVRGTGSSEGVWDSFGTREQLDGKEIVEWAVGQPWSNGEIGLHGTSYGAINQLFTAAQHPNGLRALYPIVPMADAYRDISFSGGEENTSFIPSWLGLVTALGLLPPTYAPNDPVGAAGALASHVGGVLQFQATAVAKGVTGGDTAYDGPFYRQRSPIEVIDRVEVPTAIVGGLWDLFQRGEPMLFNRLRANGVPTTLLYGPWYHVNSADGLNGLPADGERVLAEQELRWMDHFLKHMADDELDARIDETPVTYYRIGENHFSRTSSWPPPDVQYEERFLSGPAMPTAGSLADTPPVSQAADLLPWQPASGACSRSTSQWTAAGVRQGCEEDERLNDAAGSLSFDLPVETPLDLAGPIAAHLYVSTNARDAFITARLEDVDPSGKVTELTTGWCILSQRALDMSKTLVDDETGLITRPYHPFTKATEIEPVDEITDLWVEIFPTAARLAKDHMLRLSLQPSDAPHLSPSIPRTAALAGGVLSLYHDEDHPSSVVLPLEN